MLKKLVVLLLALGIAFGVMMATTRSSTFDVSDSLNIGQTPETIWQALTAVEQWPGWWPGVQEARLEPGLQQGAALHLILKGTPERQPAHVAGVVAPHRFAWSRPGVLGSSTMTEVRIEPTGGGALVSISSRILGPQAFMARFTGKEEFSKYHRLVLERLMAFMEQPAPPAAKEQQ